MILFYITCKDEKEAEKISKHLLKNNLVACSNIFPIKNMYKWKGKINQSKESVLILKVLNKNKIKAEKELKKLHSYDIPFIGKIKADVNEEYEKWAKEIA